MKNNPGLNYIMKKKPTEFTWLIMVKTKLYQMMYENITELTDSTSIYLDRLQWDSWKDCPYLPFRFLKVKFMGIIHPDS